MDFTCRTYENLLVTLKENGFCFQTFEEFIKSPSEKVIILRHDVDKRPEFACRLAIIESSLGIKGSYHFRIVKDSNQPECMKKIAGLGHELAYHYEDLNLCSKKNTEKGNKNNEISEHGPDYRGAYDSFLSNLSYFRQYYPVRVISMHGSPASKIDNRDLWKVYNYRDAGVICEPYFDIDYSRVLYLTDTGRTWNGMRFNVRDKVSMGFGSTTGIPLNETFIYDSTSDIISSVVKNSFPDKAIISTHPQRWTNNPFWWVTEFILQTMKNTIKYFIVQRRTNSLQN